MPALVETMYSTKKLARTGISGIRGNGEVSVI